MSAGTITPGRRIYFDGNKWPPFTPGDYAQQPATGIWYACTPSGVLGNLSQHEVTEHEDGTITVKPSILVESDYNNRTWHGYLTRGEWSEV